MKKGVGKEGRRKQEERSIGDGSEKGKELERYDRGEAARRQEKRRAEVGKKRRHEVKYFVK